MGQVPVGVLLPVPGAVEDQLKGGATVSQHCPAGVQVLPQVSAEDGVQEAVRQAAQPFGPHRQAGKLYRFFKSDSHTCFTFAFGSDLF